MNTSPGGRHPRRRYHVEDLVRVKSLEEIAATLSDDGTLDAVPFMPEMQQFAGKVFRVRSSAHKTCDTVKYEEMRELSRSVHLDDLRCDGSAHGGCQARCLLYWKEDWLERMDASPRPPASSVPHDREAARSSDYATKIARSTRLHDRDPARGTYSCQATEVLNATRPLPWWSPRQYVEDVRSGNAGLVTVAREFAVMGINKALAATARLSSREDSAPRRYPRLQGARRKTPQRELGLQPRDPVLVRGRKEILETLDARGRTRGLSFDADMLRYCSSPARVEMRVERLIDEQTGELKELKNDCVTLTDAVCSGRYHRLCPRAAYFYWREIWLERSPSSARRIGAPSHLFRGSHLRRLSTRYLTGGKRRRGRGASSTNP